MYVRQILAPSLKPGDIVVVDNLSAHKDSKAKEAIEAVGAQFDFININETIDHFWFEPF